MTPDQIALVKSSWAKVVPIAEQAADIFYGRLFEVAPGVRALFPKDMRDQKQKLLAILATAVNGLDALEDLLPAVQNLGKRHISYGVKSEHYPVVGDALLHTLRLGLGAEFTPEVEAAWREVYAILSQTMIEGAAETAAA